MKGKGVKNCGKKRKKRKEEGYELETENKEAKQRYSRGKEKHNKETVKEKSNKAKKVEKKREGITIICENRKHEKDEANSDSKIK